MRGDKDDDDDDDDDDDEYDDVYGDDVGRPTDQQIHHNGEYFRNKFSFHRWHLH